VTEQLTIEVERSPDVAVVRLVGELDVMTVGRLRAALDQLLLGVEPVVVDLRDLTFIDSAGLGALVRAHKKARVLQGRLTFVLSPDSHANRLLRLTGLHRVLRVVETVEDALAP
jgi:anti-sigma B factor antagonist